MPSLTLIVLKQKEAIKHNKKVYPFVLEQYFPKIFIIFRINFFLFQKSLDRHDGYDAITLKYFTID